MRMAEGCMTEGWMAEEGSVNCAPLYSAQDFHYTAEPVTSAEKWDCSVGEPRSPLM